MAKNKIKKLNYFNFLLFPIFASMRKFYFMMRKQIKKKGVYIQIHKIKRHVFIRTICLFVVCNKKETFL